MKVLTEAEVRTGYFVKKQREFVVEPGTMVSGEARSFIEKNGLKLVEGSLAAPAAGPAGASAAKPEHLTQLRGKELVAKNDARIAFRGLLDSTQAKILACAMKCQKYGCQPLYQAMVEAVELLRRAMAADVKNEPLGPWTFLGLTAAQLREHSHHPEQYYGVGHTLPCTRQGYAALEMNLLRTQARELELAFARAFIKGEKVSRPDLAELLNRLSSGFYILYCRAVAGEFEEGGSTSACGNPVPLTVPVEVSARHVHLCAADVEALFGPGHRLTRKRDLSQGGEFLSEERVTLRGPKGEMQNVAVLGPERSATQVELSGSDARALGIQAPLRLSGDLQGAADCAILSGRAELSARGSAIIARNHLHLTPADAAEMGLRDGQTVEVRVEGERPVTFSKVAVRVNPQARKFMHIDFDEANAALINGPAEGRIVRKD